VDTDARTRRWTRAEYERLIDIGFFGPGDWIELVGGEVVVSGPPGSRHSAAVRAVQDALRIAFGPGWEVRGPGPLALDDESEPEPDVAVVSGRDEAAAGAWRPVLVVEVSDSSLALDRDGKGSLYARAGVDDYWIVNLVDGVVEVRRRPARAPAAVFGWRYTSVEVCGPGRAVSPLAAPRARLRVADLLR